MTVSDRLSPISVGQLAAIASAIGSVVDCAGSSRFLRELFACVTRFVDCDSLHLQGVRVSQQAQPRRIEWIGSYGTDLDGLHRTMQTYFGSFAERDPLTDSIVDTRSIKLIHRSVQAIEDTELRCSIYDVGNIHDECVVVRSSHGTAYSLSACRARRLPPFSLYELSILQHLGQILLPLAELHSRVIGVAPRDQVTQTAPTDLMKAYLTRGSIALSMREASVCSAFIKGMTTLSIAEAMGLKESTIETYAKRAFTKLGVTSRRGLLSLVHSGEAVAGRDGQDA